MGYLTRNVKKASKTSVRKLQRRSERRLPNTGVSGQSELSRMIHGVEYRDNLVCTVQYNIVQYSTVHNYAIRTGLVQYCTVLCCIVQYIIVLHRIVQYCAVSSSAILL